MTQSEITSSEIKNIKILYLYGVSLLMLFCVISIIVNIKILITTFWIKCPLSPTLYISLSLTGADAFSSFFLGIELLLNSFIPIGLGIELKGSFVVGWMPAVITFVLVCDDCILQLNRVSARVIFFIHVINNGLIILKTLVNPIIYAAQMDEIKVN
ncbi:hypothetical protein G5I_05697 [Acromyrmex echinatior]|uniref:G-protein coupled receptors family 1 profile domain-containing protein n=1 Tax=Acromyrmex echinatior TaxID=103372 RepID=F4WJ21_ACREC|nr:hypothetical protein G5I_05697 [Acromyrmex echinatior]